MPKRTLWLSATQPLLFFVTRESKMSERAMPNIQMSLASAMPSREGRTLPSWCIPGVRRYMPTSPPENAPRPRPASRLGMIGRSKAPPRATSAAPSTLTKVSASIDPSAGYAFAAMACNCLAVSSSCTASLPRPEFRMKAPVAARMGRCRSLVRSDIRVPYPQRGPTTPRIRTEADGRIGESGGAGLAGGTFVRFLDGVDELALVHLRPSGDVEPARHAVE